MKRERDGKRAQERKQANKDRQSKPTDQRATKRQKMNGGEYKEKKKVKKNEITIEKKGKRKENFGEKNKEQHQEKGEEVKEKETIFQKAGKKKRELSDLEKWIQEREEGSKWTSFPNYDERAKEINRRILKEERDRESRIERARKEEKSWELLRLCMSYLEENCDIWKESMEERRKLEEKERNREDRRRKAEKEKLTFKCGFAQKKITTFLKNLPSEARRNFESEEERKRRVKLKEVKETIWKRTRKEGENLQRENNLQTGEDHYKSLTELESKLKDLEAIKEKCDREEKERMEMRKEMKRSMEEKRWKKEERLKLKKKLEEKWAMMRWIVNYIDENKEQWTVDKEIRQSENAGEILLGVKRMSENESEKDAENWSENENKIVRETDLRNDEKWMEWRARAKEKSKIKGRNKLPSVAELSHPQVTKNDECEAKTDKEDMLMGTDNMMEMGNNKQRPSVGTNNGYEANEAEEAM